MCTFLDYYAYTYQYSCGLSTRDFVVAITRPVFINRYGTNEVMDPV